MIVRNDSGGPLQRPSGISWPVKDVSNADALDSDYNLKAGAVVDLSDFNTLEDLTYDPDLRQLLEDGDLVRIVNGVDVSASDSVDIVNGFIDYNDSGSTVSLAAGVWVDISNDGAGAFSNDDYPPPGISDLMDTSDGSVDFTQTDLGDWVIIRQHCDVTPQINGGEVEVRIQLGTGLAAYSLPVHKELMFSGAGRSYVVKGSGQVYMGDLNTKDNPGVLQIKSSVPASMVNVGAVIQVIKRGKP